MQGPPVAWSTKTFEPLTCNAKRGAGEGDGDGEESAAVARSAVNRVTVATMC
jgi:hypothetical protein